MTEKELKKTYQLLINSVYDDYLIIKPIIEYFNYTVYNYGKVKVGEILQMIPSYYRDADYEKYKETFLSYKFGWTEQISLEDDFIISAKGNMVMCKFNLPEPQSFFEESSD